MGDFASRQGVLRTAARSVTADGLAAVAGIVTEALLLGADLWPAVSVTTTVKE